jgi:chromate transporter
MNDEKDYSRPPDSYRKKYQAPKLEEIIEDSFSKEDELLSYTYRDIKPLSFKDAFSKSFRLGYTSFGGQRDHQLLIKKEFVDGEYITESEYRYLLTLCKLLPGYSSTQFLTTIATLKTDSILGGLLAFIGFISPSLIAVLILTYIIKSIKIQIYQDIPNKQPNTQYFTMENDPLIYSLMVISSGVSHGALALLITAAYIRAKKLSNSHFQVCLLVWAGLMYYYFDNYVFILILILICGFISMFKQDQHYLLDQCIVKFKLNNIRFLGTTSLVLFTLLFIVFSIADLFSTSQKFRFLDSFMRIGSLCFGEGHVVVPFILTEYSNKKLLEESDVLDAFTIVSLLPGPMFNIAAYVGVMVDDFISGILSGIIIFIPGILIAFSALPFINKIKNSAFIQYFIRGASSAALGFVFTASFTLWIDSCFVNPYNNPVIGTLNVILCYLLAAGYDVYKPAIIIFGALFLLFSEYFNYFVLKQNI